MTHAVPLETPFRSIRVTMKAQSAKRKLAWLCHGASKGSACGTGVASFGPYAGGRRWHLLSESAGNHSTTTGNEMKQKETAEIQGILEGRNTNDDPEIVTILTPSPRLY